MSDNQTIHSILETYPDKEANDLERLMRAEARKQEAFSRAYLTNKEGTKMSIDDAKHRAEIDPAYLQCVQAHITAKVAHTRTYNKLLSARKEADLIGRGL